MSNSLRQKVGMVVAHGWREEEMGSCLMGMESQFRKMKKFLECKVAQQRERT